MAGLFLKRFYIVTAHKYIYLITHDCLVGPSLCGCSDRPAQSHMVESPGVGSSEFGPLVHQNTLGSVVGTAITFPDRLCTASTSLIT